MERFGTFLARLVHVFWCIVGTTWQLGFLIAFGVSLYERSITWLYFAVGAGVWVVGSIIIWALAAGSEWVIEPLHKQKESRQ